MKIFRLLTLILIVMAPITVFAHDTDEPIKNEDSHSDHNVENHSGHVVEEDLKPEEGKDPFADFKEHQLIHVFAIFKIGEPGYKMVRAGMESEYESDTVPYIKNGRTMLSLRTVAELLDMEVNFDNSTRTAKFVKPEEYEIDINIDTGDVKVDGKDAENIKDFIDNKDGRLYISITKINDFIKETSEEPLVIEWKSDTKEVYVHLS
ncbi:MAG: copper amine oxidase N-terminal domain-containing protein [Ezakiella coagulans]|uniref:copper amine oxidase N-terminal domain-containing protein n=1 Tax=Ezakiella coagulans TaxID=46507 RepID=UPI00399B7AAA